MSAVQSKDFESTYLQLEYIVVYGHASMGGLCTDCTNRTRD